MTMIRFMSRLWLLFLALFSITLPNKVYAAEIHPVISIGYDMGGDALLDYVITKVNDRDVNLTDKITAGNGLTLSAGVYVPIFNYLGIQATAGLKIDSTTFVNTYVAFSRNPLDVLANQPLG